MGTEVRDLMFWSVGQSDVKSPVFSSQASLKLIYRPTEDIKDCPVRDSNPDLWRESAIGYISFTGLYC
ncbi:hypothetical protein TNCV_1561251 [Trichonephila clavipes]|nr:hypothetical protein TNCV_1561251 [Trichonephila clavipes]